MKDPPKGKVDSNYADGGERAALINKKNDPGTAPGIERGGGGFINGRPGPPTGYQRKRSVDVQANCDAHSANFTQ